MISLRTRPARSSLQHVCCCKLALSTTAVVARAPPKAAPKPLGERLKWLPDGAAEQIKSTGSYNPPSLSLRGNIGSRQNVQRTHNIFRRLVLGRIDIFAGAQGSWNGKQAEFASFNVNTQADFDREVSLFRDEVDKACERASALNATNKTDNPLFWTLRNAFVQGDVQGLTKEVKFAFLNFLMRNRFSETITATHKKIADFRYPTEWFPATRAMQRKIYMHVGPTNSGKTYNALKALENAKTGIYAGPLRLLAHEVYSRFMAKNKPCALITGEEQRVPENDDNYFRSCTVEMTPLNYPVDVAVIDEIQMIGDVERGWAWTQAFLGVQAKEVHLCGEERSVELIKSLCETTGDTVEVHTYKRLSPLVPMDVPLGGLRKLEKGDAVVSFSRVGIHGLKSAIEKTTGRRCAIVYGSLPPETRAQQAALFNDPNSDYDYIAASDAIGMGLNLEIRRVIFESCSKRDSVGFRTISTSEVKQIGGRAGRYRTAASAIRDATSGAESRKDSNPGGFVTTMDAEDLKIVHKAFSKEPEPILTAGIQPPPSVLERFATYFPPNTPFSYILARLRDLAQLSKRFHLCNPKEMLAIADLIQPYPMPVYDRCVFLNAPVALRERHGAEVVQAFARCISNMDGGHILDIPEMDLELLDMDKNTYPHGQGEYLRSLEALHKAITLYLWLSYRYSGVFRAQGLAFHIKAIVEEKIDKHLAELNVTEEAAMIKIQKMRRQARNFERRQASVLGERPGANELRQGEPGPL